MILLHAKVNLSGDTNNNTIDDIHTTIGVGAVQQIPAYKYLGNNNGSARFNKVLNTYKEGGNPFLLGSSKLGSVADGGDNANFEEKVGYFIGYWLSSSTVTGDVYKFVDRNGNDLPYNLVIKSDGGIGAITIVFDDYNEEYCKYISVNNVQYTLTQPKIEIVFGSLLTEIPIQIQSWTKPNRPLRIQGIYVDVYLDIPFNEIVSSNFVVKDRQDDKQPSFGILSNSGDMTFIDAGGDYRVFSRKKMFGDACALKIYLENSNIPEKVEQIGDFYVTEWKIEANGKTIDLQYEDNLTKWQDIDITEPVNWLYNETALALYLRILDLTPDIYKRHNTQATIDGTAYNFNGFVASNNLLTKLNRTINEATNCAVSGNSLWELWEYFAVCFGLYIAKDGSGNVIMVDEI